MQNREKVLHVLLKDSDNIVCLAGMGLVSQSHYPNHRNSDYAYEIEQKYDYSPEELLSTRFYNTRPEQFYEYYRNDFLKEGKPCPAFYALADLEKQGKLKTIITSSVHGLPQKAGCKNVIELHGSVNRNFCPHCKREYSVDYVKNYKGVVPLCEKCKVRLHPGMQLMGEMIDNALMTKAVNAVQQADLLLLVGSDMTTHLAANLVKYYQGEKLVLINENSHYLDEEAALVLKGNPSEILAKAV